MTAHELARKLLEMPDIEVAYWDDYTHKPINYVNRVKFNFKENEVEILELDEEKYEME